MYFDYLEESDSILVKVLSQHLLGGTEDNHENLSQDSWYPGWDVNQGPCEYSYNTPFSSVMLLNYSEETSR
jgi:hypothetical protein